MMLFSLSPNPTITHTMAETNLTLRTRKCISSYICSRLPRSNPLSAELIEKTFEEVVHIKTFALQASWGCNTRRWRPFTLKTFGCLEERLFINLFSYEMRNACFYWTQICQISDFFSRLVVQLMWLNILMFLTWDKQVNYVDIFRVEYTIDSLIKNFSNGGWKVSRKNRLQTFRL